MLKTDKIKIKLCKKYQSQNEQRRAVNGGNDLFGESVSLVENIYKNLYSFGFLFMFSLFVLAGNFALLSRVPLSVHFSLVSV